MSAIADVGPVGKQMFSVTHAQHQSLAYICARLMYHPHIAG